MELHVIDSPHRCDEPREPWYVAVHFNKSLKSRIFVSQRHDDPRHVATKDGLVSRPRVEAPS